MESSIEFSSDGLDIISNLPQPIICYILSLLPTNFVVPTSLLSKRWKFLWTKVSTLDFDDSYHDPNDEFLSFVNKVLILHNSESIEKFRLSWKNLWCDAGYVNAWVRKAVARNVKVLDLCVLRVLGTVALGDDFLVHLPSSLFTCGTLSSLSLDGPFLVDVPCVVCLPKLVVLNLSLVTYGSNDSVPKLLSGCPVLNTLRIRRNGHDNVVDYAISSVSLRRLEIYFVDYYVPEEDADYYVAEDRYRPFGNNLKLKIDAPALEYLNVLDYTLHEITLHEVTSLNEAHLELRKNYADGCKSVCELVQAMGGVKSLMLSRDTTFAITQATTRLTARFERLTKLVIECYRFGWRPLKDLLDCSAKLEVLHIEKFPKVGVDYGTCSWDTLHVPDCLTYSLAQVSFSGFEGLEDELAMISFILKHGVVMKNIQISCTDPGDSKEKFDIFQKIAMFPRVSPYCQIKFS